MIGWSHLGKARQRGGHVQVLGGKLRRRRSVEWQFAGQHLLVDDRQAVLIAVPVGLAFEQLRRGVGWRQPFDHGA